jgi:hypothetical protein
LAETLADPAAEGKATRRTTHPATTHTVHRPLGENMLAYDPAKRICPFQALDHPFCFARSPIDTAHAQPDTAQWRTRHGSTASGERDWAARYSIFRRLPASEVQKHHKNVFGGKKRKFHVVPPRNLFLAFLDVSLHGESINTKTNSHKNHKNLTKKAPTHLRGRFKKISAPCNRYAAGRKLLLRGLKTERG